MSSDPELDAGPPLLAFARTARLNAVTVGLTLVFSAAIGGAPWLLPDVPLLLKVLASTLALFLLLQLRPLFGRWTLWAELYPCALRWGTNGAANSIDLHQVRELTIDEPRRYRFVRHDGSSCVVDLYVLYHAGVELDRAITERVTALRLPGVLRALSESGVHHFGPWSLRHDGAARLCAAELEIPVERVELISGRLLLTAADVETKRTQVVARHELPNLHTLAVAIELLRTQPLAELCRTHAAGQAS